MRVRHVFLTHPHFIRNCAGLLGEVVVGAEEMAQFGQQLLGLLQDVEVEQRRLLGECGTVGRQAVEVLLAQSGEAEFERLYVLQEHIVGRCRARYLLSTNHCPLTIDIRNGLVIVAGGLLCDEMEFLSEVFG